MSDHDQLRRDVALMRELGVTKWNGIELGPEPSSDNDIRQHEDSHPIVVTPRRRPVGGLVPRDDDERSSS